MTKDLMVRVSALIICTFFISTIGMGTKQETAILIDKEIQKHEAEIIKIRRFIHMNPELSDQEFETANLIASKLLSLGLEVKTGIAKTGVMDLLRGNEQGLTIGLRADMDALPIQELTTLPFKSLNPRVMHACGHDIHISIAMGTAMVMSALKDKINGNIKFIFQPAEEGVLGLHVWPENLGNVFFSQGPIIACSDWFQIIIEGKSSHGARPHEGVDAIALASQVIVSLQSIVSRTVDTTDPAVVTIGKILGATKASIIAETVTIEGTIRTLSETNRKKIPRMMKDVVQDITHSFGATYIFCCRKGSPPLYNHPDFASILSPTLSRVLGEWNIQKIKPLMVAEDFSCFCQKISGFYFLIGVKNPEEATAAPLNSPYFNPDERCIPLGTKIMCHLLFDCLERQRHIGEVPH